MLLWSLTRLFKLRAYHDCPHVPRVLLNCVRVRDFFSVDVFTEHQYLCSCKVFAEHKTLEQTSAVRGFVHKE